MLCKNRNVEPVRLQVFISVTFILDSFFDILRKLTKLKRSFIYLFIICPKMHMHTTYKRSISNNNINHKERTESG